MSDPRKDPYRGDTPRVYSQVKTASGINIALGVWLIVSTFIFDPGAPLWNNIIVGLLVIVFGWIRVANPGLNVWMSWVNVVLGVWLIIAPFALDFTLDRGAMWNSIIVGLLIAILGLWSALATRRRVV